MDKLKGMASKMGGGGSGEQKPAAGGEQQDYVDKGQFFATLISLSLSLSIATGSRTGRKWINVHICLEPLPFSAHVSVGLP